MSQTGTTIHLDWGYIKYTLNEVEIVSTVEDPPGVRLGAMAGGSLGKISGNRVRADGTHDEVAMIQLKIDERFRPPEAGGIGTEWGLVGEVRIDIRRPPRPDDPNDDKAMEPAARLLYDEIQFFKPVRFLDGTIAQAGGRASRFYSDDGRYCYNVQGDPTEQYPHGRIVQYDTHHSSDETTWTSVAILRPVPL